MVDIEGKKLAFIAAAASVMDSVSLVVVPLRESHTLRSPDVIA